MPHGQSGHPRIGTFACLSNPTAHPKQAKEPTFPPATKDELVTEDGTILNYYFPGQRFDLVDKGNLKKTQQSVYCGGNALLRKNIMQPIGLSVVIIYIHLIINQYVPTQHTANLQELQTL